MGCSVISGDLNKASFFVCFWTGRATYNVFIGLSQVPQHVLLGWVLGSLTTMARLYHFPQYKEKSESLKDIPLGLFVYPVLQAADILLYK